MSAKLKKTVPNEELIAKIIEELMWRVEQSLWHVMSPLYWDKNEKDKSLKWMSDKFHIFSNWYFWIKFSFKYEIFFQLTLEILKFQLCF